MGQIQVFWDLKSNWEGDSLLEINVKFQKKIKQESEYLLDKKSMQIISVKWLKITKITKYEK